jgi:hypothetical protein
MTVTAHHSRRVYSGATHPAPLAPLDGRKRPAKKNADIRFHVVKLRPPDEAIEDFLTYVREKRRDKSSPQYRSEKAKVHAWLIANGPATAKQIADGCGFGQGTHAARALRSGIPGIGIVDMIKQPQGGNPVNVWGVVEDEPLSS